MARARCRTQVSIEELLVSLHNKWGVAEPRAHPRQQRPAPEARSLSPAQADSGAAPGPGAWQNPGTRKGPGQLLLLLPFRSRIPDTLERGILTVGTRPLARTSCLPLRVGGLRGRSARSARARALCHRSAGLPARDSPGPREAPSPKLAQLGGSRRGVLTWGPRRQECAGPPLGRRGAGRPVFGRRPPRCLPGARLRADRGRRVRVSAARRGWGGARSCCF